MAADEPAEELGSIPVQLYDFLYRDAQRIASYYAQYFSNGRLTQSEKVRATRDNRTSTFKATSVVVGGDLQGMSESQESFKEVFDPHDIVTVDVLTRLMEQLVKPGSNVETAGAGEMVKASGRLTFLDKTLLEFASVGLDVVINQEKAKPKNQRDQAQIQGLEIVRRVLPKMPLTSSFLLVTDDGLTIAGTIKETGLDEPISGSYFKHGAGGVARTHIIGIKESDPGGVVNVPSTQFLHGMGDALRLIQSLIFPENALKMTPIAIYRELNG